MTQPIALGVQSIRRKEAQSGKHIEGMGIEKEATQVEDTMLEDADRLLGKFEMITPPSPTPLEMEMKDRMV